MLVKKFTGRGIAVAGKLTNHFLGGLTLFLEEFDMAKIDGPIDKLRKISPMPYDTSTEVRNAVEEAIDRI